MGGFKRSDGQRIPFARIDTETLIFLMELVVMEKSSKLTRVVLYQHAGFLVVFVLCFFDELIRLPGLVFSGYPLQFEFGRSTVAMLVVLAVWALVSVSTGRILNRLRYLEKFMRVCSWCHHIDYKGEWMPMEEFLKQGFDTPTTHGICPKCLAEQKAALARANAARREAANSVAS